MDKKNMGSELKWIKDEHVGQRKYGGGITY